MASAMETGATDPPSCPGDTHSPSIASIDDAGAETSGLADRTSAAADKLADFSEDVNSRADARAERWVDRHGMERLDQMMSGMINEIVGGIFAIALGVVLLNQLFEVEIIDTADGPFSDTFSTVESIGGAALIFAVLGMLALAGGTAVRMFRT